MPNEERKICRKKITSKQVRDARLKKGLLQAEVAQLLGVTTKTISNWENGLIPRHGAGAKVIEEFIK